MFMTRIIDEVTERRSDLQRLVVIIFALPDECSV